MGRGELNPKLEIRNSNQIGDLNDEFQVERGSGGWGEWVGKRCCGGAQIHKSLFLMGLYNSLSKKTKKNKVPTGSQGGPKEVLLGPFEVLLGPLGVRVGPGMVSGQRSAVRGQ
jgi:hypothetical protein